MNKKILIGLSLGLILTIVMSCLYVVHYNLANPKVILEVHEGWIHIMGYTVSVFLTLPRYATLYNCRIEIKYLTTTNTWNTTSLDIGILNKLCLECCDLISTGWYNISGVLVCKQYLGPFNLQLDKDFNYEGSYSGEISLNHYVKVEAYGYLKP